MVRQLIPEGLAEMVPGPELGALLAGIDIHAVTGADAVEILRARARQLSHEQARLLATMVEVGLCDPDALAGEVARLPESPPYAADEIRAALAWTRRAADREHDFAETLVLRMPAVFTALDTGRICRSKAWVFADLCSDLTPEQTAVVCSRLLPKATRLTTGELAARIKKLAIALDPEWAARRYATAVRERNVIGYLNEDGTATVTGSALPIDEAAVACAHVEELARATKRAGHPGRIGPLRADIYLGLLDGRWQQCTRDQIIADLLSRATRDTDHDVDPVNPAHPDDPMGPPAGGDDSAGGEPTGSASDCDSSDEDVAARGDGAETSMDGAPAAGSPAAAQPARRVGVELRVALSTLLGRDRHPGEVAGWGPVTAEVVRTVALAQLAAEWRYALTDAAGQLLLAGITRRRPHSTTLEDTAGELPPCRGGIVELHLSATLLTELAADPGGCGEWAAVVADVAAQYTQYLRGGWSTQAAQDPTARFAGAVLRRHVQIRDRSCVYPGCRATARSADLDHTRNHDHGGATTGANSGPLCRHDHRLKHLGRWRLHQSAPGHFSWISPLGRAYRMEPRPIINDLPDPRPRPDHADPGLLARPNDGPILERPPPQPDPPLPATPSDPHQPPPS
ncbi:MAG: hypothetical protein DLM61_23375 [Pseudonocardiales bacterium]|nr:MAG: hypothetical protein DLM61_23375 [Pseudonocardiales bacterium]